MFERQKKLRKNNQILHNSKKRENILFDSIEKKNNINDTNKIEIHEEKIKNKKINETLEDMCIYGNIMKEEILEEKEKNPEKFIEIEEALKLEEKDQGLFALGLLAQNLESLGIMTAIEKKGKGPKEENDVEEGESNDEKMDDKDDVSATCLQFITNGLISKKKYDLHFDLGEKRNNEILNNKKEYKKFKENLKLKLSKDYNISKDKIIITFPQRGSVKVQVIFQSDEFNHLDLNEFKAKFEKDDEFEELKNLKEIHTDVIMGACKLTKNMLDPRGNRSEGWAIGENRGNKPYNPPIGWTGIGLKVFDKYEDNTWIGMDNSQGEWCVAYHGVGRDNKSDEVKKITGLIYKGAFKPGKNQVHSECDDQYHPGKKVGEGVYCTPKIETAEEYSGYSSINGKNYKTVLMVRVKPEAIRGCEDSEDYWVVNGTTDEIRPYRILYKKCVEEGVQEGLFGYNKNLFANKPIKSLFGSISNKNIFSNAYNPFFFNNPQKRIFQKPLFMYPVFKTNKIKGVLKGEYEIITLEVDFSQAFNKQNIQLKQFIPSSAYCNSEQHLYITGGKENQKDIGKIFLRISVNNNNNDPEVCIEKMPMMNFSHWNHSMISNKDCIFSIGGYNSNKCELYNIKTLKWEKMPDLNYNERQRSMLVICKDYLYCFMGYTQFEILNSVERINITNILINKWENVNINEYNLNLKFYGSGIFNYKDEKLIFIGGKIGFGNGEEDYNTKIYEFSINNMKFYDPDLYFNANLYFIENQFYYCDKDNVGNFVTLNDGCLWIFNISDLFS